MSTALDVFKPSEHTAALLFCIRQKTAHVRYRRVLEIGTGSGVVMATLLAMGASQAVGIEIEADAIEATRALLLQQGLLDKATLVQGDMWTVCHKEQFDFIATNLPQFAARSIEGDGRLPSWSVGGDDGRALVDRFLKGLPQHLAEGGVAVMTHNVFLDLHKTRSVLARFGLVASVVHSASAPLSAQKVASMSPGVLSEFHGCGIYNIGEHWFADIDIVEIRWAADADVLP
jgi:methylase of polypeptide subunit release factors